MKIQVSEIYWWKWLFLSLVLGYYLYYAPFGINETDGGFITGLAWQVLSGKTLYSEIVYVRPPLPVWLRAAELQVLPENMAILAERWIFYGKVALYSLFAAFILFKGLNRWILAVFGFVLSAHCYPAMAWHTVDGILLAVSSCFIYWKAIGNRFGSILSALAGILLFGALLCKQSFYPLALVFGALTLTYSVRHGLFFVLGIILSSVVFGYYLETHGIFDSFIAMTSGAANSKQALQHGLLDYFDINLALLVPSLVILLTIYWTNREFKGKSWTGLLWLGWLFALMISYIAVTLLRKEHTVPFAQTRALFWLCTLVLGFWVFRLQRFSTLIKEADFIKALMLLSVTWTAAISWGYALPILFSSPLVWGIMIVSESLKQPKETQAQLARLLLLIALLITFRVAFEFVYRDETRDQLQVSMGDVYPKLSGIYSSKQTADQYLDLKKLTAKYGKNFTVLPAFPLANYLENSNPPLPLDWVVNRETNGNNELVLDALNSKRPMVFIEKNYLEKLSEDTQLIVTQKVASQCKPIEETPYFTVFQIEQEIR